MSELDLFLNYDDVWWYRTSEQVEWLVVSSGTLRACTLGTVGTRKTNSGVTNSFISATSTHLLIRYGLRWPKPFPFSKWGCEDNHK